ncbi:MAG: xanthine phosphoribosyltransferase [Clostridia bacterium]|nr:xanthine phosphoribosyltransferase [Clostridia bacterium]
MELLKETILKKGKVVSGDVLKVGSFLNNQIDVKLLSAMADDVFAHFKDKKVTKVLTVEASGIAFACFIAERFSCDAVFAKKSMTTNVDGETFCADCYSFTHKTANKLIVPKEYLSEKDVVLVADDFLANGQAVNALVSIVKDAGAELCGVAIAIEKGFQCGGDALRNRGVDIYSLAVIDEMNAGGIKFRA